jgi:nucleotide-binding universal stress UspA family protein
VLARRAAERALDVLGKSHDVTIVQVVQPAIPITPMPAVALAGPVAVPDDALTESNQSMIRDAEATVAATAAALGIDAATRVATGDPGAELCRIADDENADVIVIGSHGSGFWKRVVLGSVSHYVLHHAPCAVFVVRAPSDDIQAEHDSVEAETS